MCLPFFMGKNVGVTHTLPENKMGEKNEQECTKKAHSFERAVFLSDSYFYRSDD